MALAVLALAALALAVLAVAVFAACNARISAFTALLTALNCFSPNSSACTCNSFVIPLFASASENSGCSCTNQSGGLGSVSPPCVFIHQLARRVRRRWPLGARAGDHRRGVREIQQRGRSFVGQARRRVLAMTDGDFLEILDAPQIAILANRAEIEARHAERLGTDLGIPAVEAAEI